MEHKYYQIDEVSKITGLTKRTIRYYEDMGLFTPASRTDSGYRVYRDEDINTINEIKDFRMKLGLTVIEVKEMLGLKQKLNSITIEDVSDIETINETVEQLTKLIDLIDEREKVLNRIKNNCNNHLSRINELLKEKEKANEK